MDCDKLYRSLTVVITGNWADFVNYKGEAVDEMEVSEIAENREIWEEMGYTFTN